MKHVFCSLMAALALLSAGCVDSNLDEGGWFSCSDEQPECPSGLVCSGNRCVKPGSTDQGVPDLSPADGAPADGTVDAPQGDGGPGPDQGQPDQATPGDQGVTADQSPVDQALQPDQVLPADQALPADQSPSPDLTPPPDQALPADLTPPPDMTPPPDQSIPADLGPPGVLTVLDKEPSSLGIETTVGDTEWPAVAYGDGAYLVVSQHASNVRGRIVKPAGLMSLPFPIADTAKYEGQPDVAYQGNGQFLVVWSEGNVIAGVRVSSTGGLVGSRFVISQGAATAQKQDPAVASTGSVSLVTWNDTRNNPTTGTDIYGALVNANTSLPLSSDIKINGDSGGQTDVDVAATTSNFFVIWADEGQVPWSIKGVGVSAAGAVNSSSAVSFTGPSSTYNRFPSIASDGANYIAVWVRSKDLMAARISATSGLLGSPFSVMNVYNQLHPDVAFNGQYYLVVVGANDASMPIDNNIYISRVGKGGTLIDSSPIFANQASGSQWRPAVAGNGPGAQWLVVWQDERNPSDIDIRGTRVE